MMPSFSKRRFGPKSSVVCIGGSTGATAVLKEILSALPADFGLPIVVVQHIARGFARGMAEWLDSVAALSIKVAADQSVLEPGQALITPDDRHLVLVPDARVRLLLPEQVADAQHLPCINVLFASAAKVLGESGIGVILSGMGADGAEGLLEMRRAGAVTLGQDSESSVVYGMPKVADEIGAVAQSLSPGQIVRRLLELAKNSTGGR